MSLAAQDVRGHVQRIVDTVRLGQPSVPEVVVPESLISDSWARCLEQYRLDPVRSVRPAVLDRGALSERQARLADLVAAAGPEMSLLHRQLDDPDCAVVLTDTDGVIIHLVASADFARRVAPMGMRAGAVWSEAEAGTNGMGTCLAAARPVAIGPGDHFFARFAELSCSAVPVLDPRGALAGVLDVTTASTRAPHPLALLDMTARLIENRWIDRAHPDSVIVHFHSQPDAVFALREGRLMVQADGRICAANRSALEQLRQSRVADLGSVEHVFSLSIDDLLARSQRNALHPLPISLGALPQPLFVVARVGARAAARWAQTGVPAGPAASVDTAAVSASAGSSSGPSSGLAVDACLGASPALAARRNAEGAAAPATGLGVAPNAPTAPTAPVGPPARAVPPGPDRRAMAAPPDQPCFQDPALQRQLLLAQRMVARGIPVLLQGETGSGKEVFARAVHAASPRAGAAFVAVNCAALPETLIESELFGYKAGAFTGARGQGRRGLIAQAHGGTLMLDEIGDMPLALQARLLRVLDERRVTPLGSEESMAVDLQLVSASHRDLQALVAAGTFREDLYYRLCGLAISLPPLRERSDVSALIDAVLAQEAAALPSQPAPQLAPEARACLLAYRWPGNARQLRRVLQTALAMTDGPLIEFAHLGAELQAAARNGPDAPPVAARNLHGDPAGPAAADTALAQRADRVDLGGLTADDCRDRAALLQRLHQHRWIVSHVAQDLGISRNSLYRRLHRLRIPLTHGA